MRIRLFGSLGDEVALTALPREVRRQHPHEAIYVECRRPELFERNPWMASVMSSPDAREDFATIDLPLAPEPATASLPFEYGRLLGVSVIDPTPELYAQPDERRVAEEAVGAIYRNAANVRAPFDVPILVAIDPWAGWPRRRWPLARWRAVAERLCAAGAEVVEVGATVSDCTGAVRPARMLDGIGTSLVDRLSIGAAAVLLGNFCTAFLGNDSGLAHVAAAVRCPAVVPYAVPWWTRAYPTTVPVQPGASARCYVTTEHCPHEDACLDPVSVDHMMATVELVLAARRRQARGI